MGVAAQRQAHALRHTRRDVRLMREQNNGRVVAHFRQSSIEIIDTKTFEIVGNLPSGADPELFTQDPTGKILYVANENNNLVTIIDLEKRAVKIPPELTRRTAHTPTVPATGTP